MLTGQYLTPSMLEDDSMAKAYAKFFEGARAKKFLSKKDVATIIRAALDGKKNSKRKINDEEIRDLKRIFKNAPLDDKAKKTLQKFSVSIPQTMSRLKNGPKKDEIRTTIGNTYFTKNINFKLGMSTYSTSDYVYIAKLIRDNDISVYTYTRAPKTSFVGRYRSSADSIYIADADESGSRDLIKRKSTMIHEATHAIQDKQNKVLKLRESEAAAHIAQAVMILTAYKGDITELAWNDRLWKPGIRDAALRLYQGKSIDEEMAEAACKVISESKAYGGEKSHGVRSFHKEWNSFVETILYELNT